MDSDAVALKKATISFHKLLFFANFAARNPIGAQGCAGFLR